MANTLKVVYEDSKGGPYVNLYVNDRWLQGKPLNPGQEVDVNDIGSAAIAVARELGAEVVIEREQVLYDARGDRVDR